VSEGRARGREELWIRGLPASLERRVHSLQKVPVIRFLFDMSRLDSIIVAALLFPPPHLVLSSEAAFAAGTASQPNLTVPY